MEVDAWVLLGYFAAWSIFYALLSRYIAKLSKDEWVKWAKSADSDEDLIEILNAVIEEIEIRMEEKLEHFQSSFFGSLGAASKKMDNATGQSTIKALTRDNPMLGFVADYLMKRGNLGGLMDSDNQNTPPKQSSESARLGLKE
jgi:hypothetical protein